MRNEFYCSERRGLPGSSGSGKRLPPPKPIPKSRPIPHHSTPLSVWLFPPSFPCLRDKSSGNAAPKVQNVCPGPARAVHARCIPTLHTFTHFLPCPALPPPFTPRFLHPSFISLANLKPFPFCCADSFNFFSIFFKGKRYFPSCFQTAPDLALPIPSSFSLGRIGPLKFFPLIVG